MYIKDMNVVNTNPNFTIVLPVFCNAGCNFCSWKESKQDQKIGDEKIFLQNLKKTLEELPEEFTQITISGGEPTLYKDLNKVLMMIAYHKDKFKKVVFTTNGVRLKEYSTNPIFTEVVDFVNISRHHFVDSENDRVMKTKSITFSDIKEISENLGSKGIPVNINCVLEEKENIYSLDFMSDFIEYSRNNYVNSITFRKDYMEGFGISDLEERVQKDYSPKQVSECPVCLKTRYIIKGMEVNFTTSEFEPKDILKDDIYEVILQPDGILTSDWEGEKEISFVPEVMFRKSVSRPAKTKSIKTPPTFEGCGFGMMNGCG